MGNLSFYDILSNKRIFFRIPNDGLNFIEYRITDPPLRYPRTALSRVCMLRPVINDMNILVSNRMQTHWSNFYRKYQLPLFKMHYAARDMHMFHASSWLDLCDYYNDVIMSTMASQITSLTIVYSTVCSGADQRKLQSRLQISFMIASVALEQ